MSSRMAFQVGDRFGKLVILRQDGVHKKPCGTTERRWLCKCDLFRAAKYATEPKTIWIKGNLSSGREKLQIIQLVYLWRSNGAEQAKKQANKQTNKQTKE